MNLKLNRKERYRKFWTASFLIAVISIAVVCGGCREDGPVDGVSYGQWQLLGLENETVTAIAVHPTNPNIIYTGTGFDFSAGIQGKLFKSTNSGKTWDTLIVGGSYKDILIDPINPEIVYAIPYSILKSTNGGKTWLPTMNGIRIDWETRVGSFAIDPHNTNVLYAGTAGFFGGRFYKSTDGGMSWRDLSRGDTLREGVVSIAIDHKNSNIVYAGTADAGRLWKTSDGGDTWILTGLGTTNSMFDAVAVSPFNSNTVYASVRFMGFFLTNDGGITWEKERMLDTIIGVVSILFSKLQPFSIYLATTKGCLIKRNRITNWYYLNEGLINKSMNTIEFYKGEKYLLAGFTKSDNILGGIYIGRINESY